MPQPIIQASGLSKVYPGGRTALAALDLSVSEGEIFGFLGPNGAGKTSTIKILTTLSRPSSGTASVAGFDIVRAGAHVRQVIGYVAQEAGVDYFLTGRENLLLQGRLYHLQRRVILQRTEELLRLFDLLPVADQLVSSYSGGTKRKLDIATALLHRPRVLFLDEPTLGLDLQSRHALWEYIRRLNHAEAMTIFLTTHYLEEADKLAHRIAIIDEGGVKTTDTPEALKDGVGGDAIRLRFEAGMPGQDVWQAVRRHPAVIDLIAEGETLCVVARQGREALPKLLPVLDECGVKIRSITVSQPSLDDVFLKHTGKAFEPSDTSGPAGGAWWTKWQKGSGSGSRGNGATQGQDQAAKTVETTSVNGSWQQWQTADATAEQPKGRDDSPDARWPDGSPRDPEAPPAQSWPRQGWKGKE